MKTKKMVRAYKGFILGCAIVCTLYGAAGSVTCKAAEAAKAGEQSNRFLNIGSVSKVYPVTAVMQLAEKGQVDLDAPVTDYIPDFKLADERYKDITVRMLMNHTSGLMGSDYGGSFLFGEARDDYHDGFLKHLASQQLKADPGAFNCYCNDGFTLLEILVERVSGKSFTEYLAEEICKPLSLEHTGTLWNMDLKDQAPVYISKNTKIAAECPQLIGAGGIMSNAADVSTFGSAFFTGKDILLSEASKKEMAKDNRAGDGFENFGLGWDSVGKKDYDEAGVTILSKGGDTMFQHGSLVVAPDEQISVAVLSAGGDSSANEKIALKLMDLALSDQGTEVVHPKEEKPELADLIPEEYLSYEGVYADMQKTLRISFPQQKYMLVTSLTSGDEFEAQYLPAKDGSLVKVNGDVSSGKAIPVSPVQSVRFEEKDGQIYLSDPGIGYFIYKAPAISVDEKVQSAWDERSGVRYYCVSGRATDAFYLVENVSVKLQTDEAAKGYVNGYVMKDEDHAGFDTILPSTASRDLSNISIERADGKEYLNMEEIGYRYISEKSIPAWTDGTTQVELKSNEASWFKIEDAKDVTLRFDIPKGAAVHVYDRYGNLKYSSLMEGYGDKVPLPENGMIVFVGETGSSVTAERVTK